MALITATHVLVGPNTGRSIKRCRQLRGASSFFPASEQNSTGLLTALGSQFCYRSHASGLDLTLAHKMEATRARQERVGNRGGSSGALRNRNCPGPQGMR